MTKIGVGFETTRCNYNLPTKLVERVKQYSKDNGVPITYGVVQLLNKGLENDLILKYIPQLIELAKQLDKKEKNIDTYRVKELSDLININNN